MVHLLEEHAGYLRDTVKRARFDEALRQVVHPGAVVLDLGCGSGVLGLMALRHGAARVHFVDETAALVIARRTVEAAGFSDRAQFHRANAFELTLDESVDIVVCDHIGYFGLDYGAARLLADAARRFLRPGGIIIPQQLRLEVAGVCEPTVRAEIAAWRDGTMPTDFAWLAADAARRKVARTLTPDALLTAPGTVATILLGRDDPDFVSGTVELTIERDGMLDGIGGWFDCTLVDGVTMTNAPTAGERLDRNNIVLPVEQPMPVRAGDQLQLTVMLRPAEELFAWRVSVPARGLHAGLSTWDSALVHEDAVVRAHRDRPVHLSAHGRLRQVVLGYCDGKRSVSDIVSLVKRDHGLMMPSLETLEAAVLRILGRDAER